jgi:hypothetical protein
MRAGAEAKKPSIAGRPRKISSSRPAIEGFFDLEKLSR